MAREPDLRSVSLAKRILIKFLGEVGKDKLKDYLRVKEAADFLGVSPNTVRNWSRDGKMPVRRNPVNGYRLFARSDLQRLLKKIDRSVSSMTQER